MLSLQLASTFGTRPHLMGEKTTHLMGKKTTMTIKNQAIYLINSSSVLVSFARDDEHGVRGFERLTREHDEDQRQQH